LTDHETHTIIAGIADLKRGQEAHADQMSKLEYRLFGDGRTGDLPRIEDRLNVLEKFRYALLGGAMALGTFGAFVEDLLRWLLHGGKR
jgi:hypothetical protein